MRHAPIADITIEDNRQRQEFDAESMQQLVDSIESVGLLHAPVLESVSGRLVLRAGERRLRAIASLAELGTQITYDGQVVPLGSVPFTLVSDLDLLAREELELDENLRRVNLTWQEHAAAVQRLDALRRKQAEARNQLHTVADTALEVRGSAEGIHHNTIRKELIVAKHLDNPVVAKAKSVDEAFKILKAQEKAEQNCVLARAIGKNFAATGLPHAAINGDCVEWLKQYTGPQFDVLLTDPPYGMGADTFTDGQGRFSAITHTYDDSFESWIALMHDWIPLVTSVMKPDAHAYIFCDPDNFPTLKELMLAHDWRVFRTPLISYKINSGRVPWADSGPRRSYETILYAVRGAKKVNVIRPDVIPNNGDDNVGHGAQKSVELFRDLLTRSVSPGERVLDCFAGTGTTVEAADAVDCIATAIEMDPNWYAEIIKRVERIQKSRTLSLPLED